MKIKELKTLLKDNKINFYTYWDKKKLIALANEHDLLPKKEPKKEKSKKVKDGTEDIKGGGKYDRLKTIRYNPRKVTLMDIETDEIKTFPSIYKAAKFIDQAPLIITYWNGGVWKNKYKIVIEYFYYVFNISIIKLIFGLSNFSPS